MPCGDPRDDIAKRISSALSCALMRVLEDQCVLGEFLRAIDYKRAGITREEVDAWWADHKRSDEIREKYRSK